MRERDSGAAGDRPRTYCGQRGLVIGAGGGLGGAFVSELIEGGCDLAVAARRNLTSEAVWEGRARELGRVFFSTALDLRSQTDTEAACRRAVQAIGVPTLVVNCAGVVRDAPLARMQQSDWDDVLEINLAGAFRVLRCVVPLMMKSGGGRIVNVASVGGIHGQPGQANYAASKGGLIAMTRALARELGPFNITVNALAPGWVDTKLTAGLSQPLRRRALARIPLRRFASPEEIVAAARVLLQPDTRYVNGHVLVVDGGLTA
jgi:3-oxoacyl-[acyl-carrier protein] reductase